MVCFPRDVDHYPQLMAESLREVNFHCWILEGKLLIEHHEQGEPCSPPDGAAWSDGKGGFYTIAAAPVPVPPSRLVIWPGLQLGQTFKTPDNAIKQGRDGGVEEALWNIGNATLSVRAHGINDTRAHTTLEYFKNQPLSFSIPKVLFHTEYPHEQFPGIVKHIMITNHLDGTPLIKRWPGMDEAQRKKCAARLASISKELAAFTSPRSKGICGIDGNELDGGALSPWASLTYHPHELLQNWDAMGRGCSDPLVFLNPPTLDTTIVDANGDVVGIDDWSHCGFFPTAFLRTDRQFMRGYTNILPTADAYAWIKLIDDHLRDEGFPTEDINLLFACLKEQGDANHRFIKESRGHPKWRKHLS